METQALIVFCTHPNPTDAQVLAKKLIDTSLAACVNLIPQLTSVYRWENQIQIDKEVLMLIKTIEKNYSVLEIYLKKHHPYDCPEIIATPIIESEPNYLHWLVKNSSN